MPATITSIPTIFKTASEFAKTYQKKHPDGHFFDRDTLRFFGERFSDMRVLKKTVNITDCTGREYTCYVLSSVQRNHPSGPTRVYHYFDVETFEDIFPDPRIQN